MLGAYQYEMLTRALTAEGIISGTLYAEDMKILITAFILSLSTQSFGKMELTKEIKRGLIVKDACGNFEDGVKALQRLQDTSSFDNDGQIALYNFSSRALAALYKQKMIHEKNKSKRAYYRGQYELACRNSG